MRLIGNISEEAPTKSFVAFLLTKNIDAVAEKVPGKPGDGSDSSNRSWAIWIKEEDDLPKAKKHFEEFQQDPDNPRYAEAVEEANRLMKETYAKQERTRDKVIVMRGRWNTPASQRKPLTVTIMVISIAVFLMTSGWQFGNFRNRFNSFDYSVVLKALSFVHPDQVRIQVKKIAKEAMDNAEQEFGASQLVSQEELEARAAKIEETRQELIAAAQNDIGLKTQSIRRGEVWRVATPMFIHFGILHIVLNMMWLNSLGGQFENTYGTARFGLFVLVASIVANLFQSFMPTEWQGSGALSTFGGMSGVNYALAGFIWMKTLYAPQKGLYLSPINMYILLIWMFIGIVEHETMSMANWCHGVGLVFGFAVGYAPELFGGNKSGNKTSSKSS